jgi:hypothetical protein
MWNLALGYDNSLNSLDFGLNLNNFFLEIYNFFFWNAFLTSTSFFLKKICQQMIFNKRYKK